MIRRAFILTRLAAALLFIPLIACDGGDDGAADLTDSGSPADVVDHDDGEDARQVDARGDDAAADDATAPRDVAELPDLGPFEVPTSCEPVDVPMADPSMCESLEPDRLPPSLPDTIWVRGDTFLAIGRFFDADVDLISLNGPEELRLDDIHSVWGCDGEWWAGGERGRVFQRKDGAFARIDLPESFKVQAGHGCGAAVVAAGDGVWRRDAEQDTWSLWADSVSWENPDPMDKPIDEIIDITRVGAWTVALGNYGDAYIHNTIRDEWWYHGRTDDLNSDVFIRADGRGFTLHYGYGLYLDANIDFLEEGHRGVDINDIHQVERISDTSYWLVGRYNTDGEALRLVEDGQCSRFPDIPTDGFPIINIGDAVRDGERLWFTALLHDPESPDRGHGIYTLHPDQGWCVFPFAP